MGDRAMALALAIPLALAVSGGMSGCYSCTNAGQASVDISRQADNFEITRRITVFNLRTNEVMWQLAGNFSTNIDGNDLDIIVDRGDGSYQKFYFKLGEWTTYFVEDLDNTDWPAYDFELRMGGD